MKPPMPSGSRPVGGAVHLAHAPFAKLGDDLVRPDSRADHAWRRGVRLRPTGEKVIKEVAIIVRLARATTLPLKRDAVASARRQHRNACGIRPSVLFSPGRT